MSATVAGNRFLTRNFQRAGLFFLLLLGHFFRGKLRLLRRLRGHEHLERIKVRLQPGFHLLLHRAGEETDVLAERHDRTRDRHAVVKRAVVMRLVQRATDGEQRLARAGLAEAGDQRNRIIQERVHEELLLQVARTDRNAAGRFDAVGNAQAFHHAVAIIARGHRLAFVGTEQDVFIQIKRLRGFLAEVEFTFGAKALDLVNRDGNLAVGVLVVGLGNLVVKIVLRFEADRAGFKRHVHVFRDEDGRRRVALLHEERGGDDAVVLLREIGEHRAQLLHERRILHGRIGHVRIDDHRKRASVFELHALVHGARVGQQFGKDAVDPTGVAASFGGLLGLDGVELFQNLDRDGQVVVLEFEYRLRVVEEDVGVQDEGLRLCGDLELRFRGFGLAQVFHLGW